MTQHLMIRTTALSGYLIRISALVLFVAFLSACSMSLPKLSRTQSHDSITTSFDEQRALKRALAYWGKEYSKDPKNATAAYNYANNLIIAGRVQLAFKVLSDAIKYNPEDEKLLSEYGRLALKMNKVSLAQKVLGRVNDKTATDWRALSARGTLLARNGKHEEARKDFEAALKLSPDEPTILNNLALNYALSGQAKEAEKILMKLVKNEKVDRKIVNNLALVLGVQGKFNEAENVAKKAMPLRLVKSNMDYLKRMVKKPVLVKATPVEKKTGKQKKKDSQAPSL